ncbi:MAG TPA: M13 family metallopeptidase [Bacteroidales bacterium]|nr:M13 family metallopeptidase [Bacteroidales bacterium]HPT12096.1 M13 family metallopeptidase [Bacteroidales bacterium]
MKNTIKNVAIGIGLTILVFGCKGNQNKKEVSTTEAFPVKNMDLNVKPGDDFFQYVNGTWIKNHPVPQDKGRFDAFEQLAESNRENIMDIFKEISDPNNPSTDIISRKIGDLYKSGMDTVTIEQLGLKPLDDFFTRVNNIKTIADVQNVASYLQQYGVFPFFAVFASPDQKNSSMMIANVWQTGIGLPDRDYYFKTDDASKKIREAYKVHLEKMFELLNDDPKTALLNAQTVFNIETRLAKVSFTNIENQDPQKTYNKFTVAELKALTPDFSWDQFLKTIGYPDITEININQPAYISGVDKMLKSVNVEEWKTFFRWKIIDTYASYLSKKFVVQNFDFYKLLSGEQAMPPRWKKTLDVTSSRMGEAVGQLYVRKYFPSESKAKMLTLTSNLKKSLKNRIENLTWMGAETKSEALAKLEKMNIKIGYPDKWRDYSALEIKADDYMGNIIRSNRFEFEYNMNKAGKPVDRSEWGMTPQTVNAYYDPSINEIVFPAAILQPPFFNPDADDAINYGAIGMVIGHEMTHGFDNMGRQFDKDGILRDWWTAEDAKQFEAHTSPLIDQYNKFEVLDSLFINGKLTLGENIADLGGLTIAYYAYQASLAGSNVPEKIDGYSGNQRFFLSFAQIWRGTFRDEYLRTQVNTDVHSPKKFRVNGTVFNMPEFYSAFPEVGPDNKLFIPVEKRPTIW